VTEPGEPADDAEMLNAMIGGWNQLMGLRFVRASADEVVAEVVIEPRHQQPYGIVHGGVYASMIETVASSGAALAARRNGASVVGLENHTTFLHAAREGILRVTARPLSRGRRSQVWEATVADEAGRAIATGRVRLICLEAGAAIAGETVAVKRPTRG
jgi:uncharacterized protein (TIGR00369 family)